MGAWDGDPGVEVEEVGVSEGIFSCDGDDIRAIQNQLTKDVKLMVEVRMRRGS